MFIGNCCIIIEKVEDKELIYVRAIINDLSMLVFEPIVDWLSNFSEVSSLEYCDSISKSLSVIDNDNNTFKFVFNFNEDL
jgi:hypothetical protein